MRYSIAYSGIRNSIGPNIIKDDPVMENYLALYTCVKGIGGIKADKFTIDKVCRAFKLYDKQESIKKQPTTSKYGNAKVIYEVENIKTKEVTKCTSVKEIAKLTGINRNYICTYSRTGHAYKEEWKFHKLHEGRAHKTRNVKVTHIETGKVKKFNSIREAAIFIGKSDATVHGYLNKKNHKEYKFEYAD